MANFFNPYAPYNPNMQQMAPQLQTPPTGVEFRYIQGGDNAANAYPVMPGCTMLLMDTENPYIYFKTVAFNGMPQPIKKFKIEEVIENPATNDIPEAKELPDYVTREDFNNAIDEIKGLIQRNNYSKNRGDRNGKSDLRCDE